MELNIFKLIDEYINEKYKKKLSIKSFGSKDQVLVDELKSNFDYLPLKDNLFLKYEFHVTTFLSSLVGFGITYIFRKKFKFQEGHLKHYFLPGVVSITTAQINEELISSNLYKLSEPCSLCYSLKFATVNSGIPGLISILTGFFVSLNLYNTAEKRFFEKILRNGKFKDFLNVYQKFFLVCKAKNIFRPVAGFLALNILISYAISLENQREFKIIFKDFINIVLLDNEIKNSKVNKDFL